MISEPSNFVDSFSNFIRRSGRWRDVEPEALLSRWRAFVESCEQGYQGDVEDYFNDLTARDSLEEAFRAPELAEFSELVPIRTEVEKLDSRFRELLILDAFPGISEESWWARGVVRFARRRLVEGLRQEYRISVTEV
jgi:hypothetical protein